MNLNLMRWEKIADADCRMKSKRNPRSLKKRGNAPMVVIGVGLGAWINTIGGCSTAELEPRGPLPAVPPPYVQVPHPAGYAMSDLRAIFTTKDAPKPETLGDCDADVKKLKGLTQAQAEVAQGLRELVRKDPVKYHWCFYGKISQLEDALKAEDYLDERQKKVIDTYAFAAPVARAFMQEYHDSRYVRWAVKHYRGISQWVFYRKLDLTAQGTSELVEASNPFGAWRDTSGVGASTVLDKYGIVPVAPVAPTVAAQPPTADGVPVTAPAVASQPAVDPAALPAAPEVGGAPSAIPMGGGEAQRAPASQ